MASAEHAARRSVQSTSQEASIINNNGCGRKIGSAKKKSTITSVFFGNDEDDVAACAPDVTGTECAARLSTRSSSQGESTNNDHEHGRKIGSTKKKLQSRVISLVTMRTTLLPVF